MIAVKLGSQCGADGEPSSRFLCCNCDYHTDRRNNLIRHFADMHVPTRENLECCDLLFTTKGALRDHNKQNHKEGFKCLICKCLFSRKGLLQRHMSVHTGIKQFRCCVCGYTTSSKSNLERHLKSDMKKPEFAQAAERALAELKASSTRRRRDSEELSPNKLRSVRPRRGFTINELLGPDDDSSRPPRAVPQGTAPHSPVS